jgi:hypothetical protein
MALCVRLDDPYDGARLVDALLIAASYSREHGLPLKAREYVGLANEVGDALEASPAPLCNAHAERIDVGAYPAESA